MKRPKTTADMREVFEALMVQVDEGQIDVKRLAQNFNNWLDDLADWDIFGTEGQSDPRGDARD
jgi:hypothetical protein